MWYFTNFRWIKIQLLYISILPPAPNHKVIISISGRQRLGVQCLSIQHPVGFWLGSRFSVILPLCAYSKISLITKKPTCGGVFLLIIPIEFLQGVPKRIRLGFCLISQQPCIGFSNCFYFLKTEIHKQILNTKLFLFDIWVLRYLQNKMRF